MKKLLVLLTILASWPASAQWQTPLNSVPIGRGAGVTGFTSVAPGTTSNCLVSNGTTWTSAACPGAGGITALTGDVTATGPGSVAATLAAVADARMLANVSGASSHPTATTLSAWLDKACSASVGFGAARFSTGWLCAQVMPANPVWWGAVNDGVTDATAAITSAIAASKAVFIPDGSFCSTGIALASGTTITGNGTLKACGTLPGSSFISATSISNVSISGITIDVNSTTYAAKNSVAFVTVTNGLVNNVHFLHSGVRAFFALTGCLNCSIQNSLIEDFVQSAITNGFGTVNQNFSAINNRIIAGAAITGHIIDAVVANLNSSYINNFINGQGETHFGISSQGEINAIISGNQIINTGKEAIAVGGNTNSTVTNNIVGWPDNASTDYGMSFSPGAGAFTGLIIKGNQIRASGKSCIAVGGAQDKFVVENNILLDCNQLSDVTNGDGIEIGGVAATTNGEIRKNTIVSNDGKMLYGIREFTGADTSIYSMNRIKGAATSDYLLIGASSKVLEHITSAGVVTLGNGWSATAPTIASGFCATAPSISASNGTAAFDINVGTACAGSVGTLTMPAATTAWVCDFHNVTNPAANKPDQTGGSATTVTLTNYVRTTGVAGNFTASDHIRAQCTAY